MNKKGFTLIEITAVVLTLAVIFLVSYPTLQHILKKSEANEKEANTENIIIAAKTYFNLHNSEYSFLDESTLEVTIDKLVEEDLLESNDYNETSKVVCNINNNKQECVINK